jgi:hypothetical protein
MAEQFGVGKIFFMITNNCFPNDSVARLAQFEGFIAEVRTAKPKKGLAKGVLSQAAKDLRLFQAVKDPVSQALYMDAYSWVLSDDTSWPYSFVNVCQFLGLSVEVTRSDLLLNAHSRWYSRSLQTAKKISTLIQDGLATAFGSRTSPKKPEGCVSSANSNTTEPVLAT